MLTVNSKDTRTTPWTLFLCLYDLIARGICTLDMVWKVFVLVLQMQNVQLGIKFE